MFLMIIFHGKESQSKGSTSNLNTSALPKKQRPKSKPSLTEREKISAQHSCDKTPNIQGVQTFAQLSNKIIHSELTPSWLCESWLAV